MVRPEEVGRVANYSTSALTHIFVVIRPYLHQYAHSNEIEEVGIITLSGVNVESDPNKASLLGVGSLLPSLDRRLIGVS